MKYKILFFFFCFPCFAFSQDEKVSPTHIMVSFGTAMHGTGDLQGLIYSTTYSKRVNKKKRLSHHISLGGSIHDGEKPLFFTYNNNLIDGSIRYTTAGLQALVGMGYSLIKNFHHDFVIKTSVLLRYQTTSIPDIVTIFYPASGTQVPFPVVVFQHKTPSRTYSFGGSLELSYSYTLSNRFTIGVMGSFQADTNGDNIMGVSIGFGKRF